MHQAIAVRSGLGATGRIGRGFGASVGHRALKSVWTRLTYYAQTFGDARDIAWGTFLEIFGVATIDRNETRLEIKLRNKHGGESELRLQAVRTAWRIVKDWVEAQMALVQSQMVSTAKVFLPYAVMKDGRTLAQHAQSDPTFLLGSGDST